MAPTSPTIPPLTPATPPPSPATPTPSSRRPSRRPTTSPRSRPSSPSRAPFSVPRLPLRRRPSSDHYCHFWLPKKHCFCANTPLPSSKFYGNHNLAAGNRCVPCPIDPSHSVSEDNLESHVNSAHWISRYIVHCDLILFEKFGFKPSSGVNIILFGVSVSSESASSPNLSLLGFFLLCNGSHLRAATILLVFIVATAALTSLDTTSPFLTRV